MDFIWIVLTLAAAAVLGWPVTAAVLRLARAVENSGPPFPIPIPLPTRTWTPRSPTEHGCPQALRRRLHPVRKGRPEPRTAAALRRRVRCFAAAW